MCLPYFLEPDIYINFFIIIFIKYQPFHVVMTEYLCHTCGVKTTLSRHLDKSADLPTADSCPNCGETEDFEYL